MEIDPNQFAKCRLEVMHWLHDCHMAIEDGNPLLPNPFYARTPLLTEEVVTNVINAIEGEFELEFKAYPTYHKNAQKVLDGEVLVSPGFGKLGMRHQLAIVQGLDEIYQKYKAVETPHVDVVEITPHLDEYGYC